MSNCTESWATCMTRRGLFVLTLCVRCPEPCDPCGRRSPHERLALYERTLDDLMTSLQPQTIADQGRTITFDYTTRDIKCIKDEISALKIECFGVPRMRLEAHC